MSANTLRKALGTLQDDPEQAGAWNELAEAIGFSSPRNPLSGDGGVSPADLAKLLEAARRAHDMRRESDAVARLLEMQAALAHGTPREVEVLVELARVCDEELLDDVRAVDAYQRILEVRPGDNDAEEAI